MAEALRVTISSKLAISLQQGPVYPKFQAEGVAPTNHNSQKIRLNDLSYGIKILANFSSVFLNLHIWRTDRRTEFSSL